MALTLRPQESIFESSIRDTNFWKFTDATQAQLAEDEDEQQEEFNESEAAQSLARGARIDHPLQRMASVTKASVSSISFGLLSTEEILKRSVGEVVTATLEERGLPKRGGPNDLRAGTMNRMQLCQSCEGNCQECQGHAMHITLPVPIINISFVLNVVRVLRCLCFGCVGVRVPEELLESLIEQTLPGAWETHHDRRLPKLSNLIRKRRRCMRCGDVCPAITAKGAQVYWSYRAKDVEDLAIIRAKRPDTTFVPPGLKLPEVDLVEEGDEEYEALYEVRGSGERQKLLIDNEFIRTTLLAISHAELRLLGIDPVRSHPANAVMQVALVPPPCVRPPVRYSESTKHRSEHDFTGWIQDIIRSKARLLRVKAQGKDRGNSIKRRRQAIGIRQATRNARNARNNRTQEQLERQAEDDLTGWVCGYINSESSAARSAANKRHRTQNANRKSLWTVQSGKKGQWRGNTQGKRIDYTARTVACPSVSLDPQEVGFPGLFGQVLLDESRVFEHNIESMRERVRQGSGKLEGAGAVILPDDTEIDLGMLSPAQREILAVELRPGMLVRHPMPNGTRVLQNRHPTLRRGSIMGHKIRHEPDSKVVKLNTGVLGASNTDFDGDSHNSIKTRGLEQRAEINELMAVEKQVISAQSHKPLFGLIQDSVIAAYRLTADGVIVERGEAMQAVAQCRHDDPVNHYVQRFAGRESITGKELFSCLLPDGFHFKQKVQRDSGTDIIRVHNGLLTHGRLCKRSLGTAASGIVHSLVRLHGEERAMEFIGDAQRLLGFWLSQNALTIGLLDCLLPSPAQAEADKVVNRAVERADEAIEDMPRDERSIERTEMAVGACLSNVVTHAGTIALRATANLPHKGFRDTVDSGAKGTIVNLAQVLCCVGQQNSQGKRLGSPYTRTLPCFPIPTSKRPSGAMSRGFIRSSFSQGLTPPEMFFQFMASWDALMDTSVRTSLSGYGQRKMSKAAENVVVQYDQTIRNSNGIVVDYVYGADGMDSARLDPVKIIELDPNHDSSYIKDIATLELLEQAREQQRCVIDGIPTTVLYLPFHATQRLRQFATPKAEYDPMRRREVEQCAHEHLERFCKLLRDKEEGKRALHRTTFLRLHLRLALRPAKVANFISEPERVAGLYKRLEDLYFLACVQAGEAVGLFSAENIGEPMTQLMLNVFHTAGITQVASTQGIPRLKEIIDATTNIKISNMSLFAKSPEAEPDLPVSRLALRPLDDFVHQVHIFRQPGGVVSAKGLVHEDVARLGHAPPMPQGFLEEQELCITTSALLQMGGVTPAVTHAAPFVAVFVIDHNDPKAPSAKEAAEAIRHYLGPAKNGKLYFIEESPLGGRNRFVRLRIIGSRNIEDRCRADMQARFPGNPERVEGAVTQMFHSLAHSLTRRVLFGTKLGRLPQVQIASLATPNDRFSARKGEPRIMTVGSCLRASWDQPELDWRRSMTNDILEVERVLGVEAATTLIFSELRAVVSSGGSGIADRHIDLMSTIMTVCGKVTPLTRYGDARLGKTSAIVRASFEKQNAHIIDAGVYSEKSLVNSLSDCIVVGKRPEVGTGKVSLLIDPEYLKMAREKAVAAAPDVSKAAEIFKGSGGKVQALLYTDPIEKREEQKMLCEAITSGIVGRRGKKVSWHAELVPRASNRKSREQQPTLGPPNPHALAPENHISRETLRRFTMTPHRGIGLSGNLGESASAPLLSREQMNRVRNFRPSSPRMASLPETQSAPPIPGFDLNALQSMLKSLEPTIRALRNPLYSETGEINMEELQLLIQKVI